MLGTSTSMGMDATYPTRIRGIVFNRINLLLFVLGALVYWLAYLSVLPLMASGLIYLANYLLLRLTKLGGIYELEIFSRVFAICFLMAGVAAIYANYFLDANQLNSDAASFFEISSGAQFVVLTMNELQLIHEGALAIVIWGAVYDLFAVLGFPRDPYIGILVNVMVVALCGVIAMKMTRLMFGQDPERFKRLTTLFASCGLIWLFAGIHLRDSFVMLSVTTLAYGWLYFLTWPDLGRRFVLIIAISLISVPLFGFLRTEFMYIPIAMALAGTAALVLGTNKRRYRLVANILVLFGFTLGATLLVTLGPTIQDTFFNATDGYTELTSDQHGTDSLGLTLISNRAMPIRLLLGSVYLFMFPIPFWVGFQLDSVYPLFKSFNVIFFYFVFPLLVMTLMLISKNRSQRNTANIFLLILSLGSILLVAGTSLETRHFGAFLTPIFLLALLPDLSIKTVRHNYKQLLIIMFSGVVTVHIAWVILKL